MTARYHFPRVANAAAAHLLTTYCRPRFIDKRRVGGIPLPPRSSSQRMPNVGAIGFALTVAAYLYYSLWVLLTPFVEKDVVWFHNLFPDTWWALAVPTALLVLGVTCVITFVGILGR